jgi:glucose/arabinose dehydrogenase
LAVLVFYRREDVMTRVGPLLAVLLVFCIMGTGATAPATQPRTLTGGEAAQTPSRLPGSPAIQLVKVAGGLADPVTVAAPLDGTGRLFVVERVGRVRIIDNAGNLLSEPFLDLTSDDAASGVESQYVLQGMLGLAFHPDYAKNGRFYVAYTDRYSNGNLLVVEFHVSPEDANKAQPPDPYLPAGGGQLLLDVDQPYVDHNGGTLRFGPDGYLYIALGDGGGPHDPFDYAQDRRTLFGKLLRIDVDGGFGYGQGKQRRAERILPYGIPADNPFAGDDALTNPLASPPAVDRARAAIVPGGEPYSPPVRQETWAFGLREPWQFDFDPVTGDLYIPDVGASAWEEINFQAAGSSGGENYGWDLMEGRHCYPDDRPGCPPLGVLPVAEYKIGENGCAIVGIGVYRGHEFPTLNGIYFSADYCSGKIWGLQRQQDSTWTFQELLDTELLVTGGGRGQGDELYVTACACSLSPYFDPSESPQGTIWRLVAADRVPQGSETAPLQDEIQ